METPFNSCHYNAACAFFAAQVLFTFTTMVFCTVVSVWMPTPKVPVRAPKEGPHPPTPTPTP